MWDGDVCYPRSLQNYDETVYRTLGLLVDTSLSQRRVLDQERSASHSFLNQMVREDKDKACYRVISPAYAGTPLSGMGAARQGGRHVPARH